MNRTKAWALAILLVITGNSLWAQKLLPPFQVSVQGNGKQPVILIPGFSCPGDVWNETIQQFPNGFRFHTITFPGFAGQAPQQSPSVQQWMKDVAGYIQSQQLQKPIIIGHSMGGLMALGLAAAYPDLLSGIVVVDALPSLAAFYDSNFKANPAMDCSLYGKQFAAMGDEQFLAMQQKGVQSLAADTAMHRTIVGWAMQGHRYTLGSIYCQFLQTDMRGKLATIKCPVLVLMEPSFEPYHERVKQQYAGLSQGSIKYAGKGLHFLMYDDKDWYFSELRQFLHR